MKRTHIMVHHSLTTDGPTVSWAAIEKYHRETQKWRDIGYHAGVEQVTASPDLNGYQFQALIGRPVGLQASACPQGEMNQRALHVCCVGNYDMGRPPDAMIRMLIRRVLLPWMDQFGIPPENVIGHRDYNPAKTCPGVQFDLELLRGMLR